MAKNALTTEEQRAKELERARTTGQVIGWIQGGIVAALGLVAWSFIGWIPVIAVAALAVYLVYRMVFGGRKDDGE